MGAWDGGCVCVCVLAGGRAGAVMASEKGPFVRFLLFDSGAVLPGLIFWPCHTHLAFSYGKAP